MDPRLVEGKGKPIWTVEDREQRVTPLDLQVSLLDFERSAVVKLRAPIVISTKSVVSVYSINVGTGYNFWIVFTYYAGSAKSNSLS